MASCASPASCQVASSRSRRGCESCSATSPTDGRGSRSASGCARTTCLPPGTAGKRPSASWTPCSPPELRWSDRDGGRSVALALEQVQAQVEDCLEQHEQRHQGCRLTQADDDKAAEHDGQVEY